MRKPTAKAQRVGRLTGRGNPLGGGLPLPQLFEPILGALLDDGPKTASELEGVVRSGVIGNSYTNQVGKIYRQTLDPWSALLTDALDQLADRHLVIQEDDRWGLHPKFKPNESLVLVTASHGMKAITGTVSSSDEHAASEQAEVTARGTQTLAGDLKPHRRDRQGRLLGLRVVSDEHVAKLKASIINIGWRPELGQILYDDQDRIVDGRHRLTALIELDMVPSSWEGQRDPRYFRYVGKLSDHEALGVAWAANVSLSWSPSDLKHAKTLLGGDPMERLSLTERARVELLANPRRDDKVIAKVIGATHHEIVRLARQALKAEGSDVRTVAEVERESKHEAIREAREAHPDWSNRQIADEVGVSHPTVASVLKDQAGKGSKPVCGAYQPESTPETETMPASEPEPPIEPKRPGVQNWGVQWTGHESEAGEKILGKLDKPEELGTSEVVLEGLALNPKHESLMRKLTNQFLAVQTR